MDSPTSTSINLSFGEWIQAVRRRKGLRQKDLAVPLGVSVQTISDWETGAGVPKLMPHQTQQLCRLFECSLEELSEIAEKSL